jgi:hypothetical protein
MKTRLTYEQRRNFLLTLFLIGIVLIALVARATTLVRLTFPELVKDSSAIAHVRCQGSQTVLFWRASRAICRPQSPSANRV